MQLDLETMAARVHQEIEVRDLQGYDVDGLLDEWERVKGERELLLTLHDRLKSLPMRRGWPYEHSACPRWGPTEKRAEPERSFLSSNC